MSHSPNKKPKQKHDVQPRRTMQRNHLFPVDLECFSHLLTSTSWWSSQKKKNHIQDNQTNK